MTITISPQLDAKVRRKAAVEGLSIQACVEQLINEDEWAEFHYSSG